VELSLEVRVSSDVREGCAPPLSQP
jgi:hypothetical protein